MSDLLTLGRYQLVRQLGEGGMSRVYLARVGEQSEEVVVKVLHPHLIEKEKVHKHFEREIKILSSIQHPNAVRFLDSSLNEPSGPYLVMEYVPGITLDTAMAGHRRFTLRRTTNLLVQLCDLLSVLHGKGIVHRDLKPLNMILQRAGTPHEKLKVVDFGLAKLSTSLYIAPEEVNGNGDPRVDGTPRYMSPEQVRGESMDHRGDLYSVGVILFEMLTGQRPFWQNTVEEMLVAHEREKPRTFTDTGLREYLPPEVEATVQACMAKSPASRPQSAAELARCFQEAVGDRARTAAPARSASETKAEPTPPRGPTLPANDDPNAITFHMDVTMPESMAMAKLRGFIHDQNGTIVESVPGMIRVQIVESTAKASPGKSGILSWLSAKTTPETPPRVTEMRLHMQKKDGARDGAMALSLVLRQKGQRDANRAEFRARCERIYKNLQAYLMRAW
jgi:serine/threonine-protein kinase